MEIRNEIKINQRIAFVPVPEKETGQKIAKDKTKLPP